MKSTKRGIAAFLAALLLIPNVPVHAAEEAADGSGGRMPDIVQYNTGYGICTVMENLEAGLPEDGAETMPGLPGDGKDTEAGLPEDGAETVTGAAVDADGVDNANGENAAGSEEVPGGESAADGEEIANSGESAKEEDAAGEEIPVDGADTANSEEVPENGAFVADGFFDADGSYTIQIPEVDPFFPYEVQFTYNGNTANEWFMTPEDTVEIGGHVFYVSAEFTGTVITQMSMEVAGNLVTVYPVEKEFPEQKTAGYSLLPLEEKSLQVDLTAYTPMELSMVKIAEVFAGEKEFTDTDKIMWSYGADGDDFTVSTSGNTVDMRDYNAYQMIVGNDDQLDVTNIRYIIQVQKTSMDDWLIPSVYTQKEDGTRTEILVHPNVNNNRISFSVLLPELGNADQVYLGLELNTDKFQNARFDHIEAYEGYFRKLEDALKGKRITDQIWKPDMSQKDSGYSMVLEDSTSSSYTYMVYKYVTLVTFDAEGNATGFNSVYIWFAVYPPDFAPLKPQIYKQEQGKEGREIVKIQDIQAYSPWRNEQITISATDVKDVDVLYLGLTGYDQLCRDFGCDHIKVYEGSYKTEAETVEDKEITRQIWIKDTEQTNPDIGYPVNIGENRYYVFSEITFVAFDLEDHALWLHSMQLYIYINHGGLVMYGLRDEKGESISYYEHNSKYDNKNDIYFHEWSLYSDDNVDAEYFLRFGYRDSYGNSNLDAVLGAYIGMYATMEEAKNAGAENIKDALFGAKGYGADCSKTVYFTIFAQMEKPDSEGVVTQTFHYAISTEDSGKYRYLSNSATDLKFDGINDQDGNRVGCYIVDTQEDSYADFNYLTILVDKDTDLAKLAPIFRISKGSNLYVTGSSSPEISGKSVHDFSGGSMQYTVASEDGSNSKNYWLQIIKPSGTEKSLYVNSLADPEAKMEGIQSKREVMLDTYHNNIHDILVINMGSEVVTGAAVTLVSDTVELDDYWTLKGKLNLSGFDGIQKEEPYGELANMAKIRLRMKEGVAEGTNVSGTLTIKSSTEDLLVFQLTGTVGDPSITTTEIPDAVKYVPYGTMIQNSNKYSWNRVSYSLYSGELPEGMVLRPNGELYGVPKETGEFQFRVKMENSGRYYNFAPDYKIFTLKIKENTNENVDAATDAGYDVTTRIQNLYVGDTRKDELFVCEGIFNQLVDVYLDGEKLVSGKDYSAESGSTRITIMAETLDEGLDEGTHTLGVEFRDEENSLKKAAQNFDVVKRSSTGGSTGGGSTGGSSVGVITTPEPTATATPTPTPTATPTPTSTPVTTPTPRPTATPTPRPTATPRPTNTPTSTPVPTKEPEAGLPFVKNEEEAAGWDAIKEQLKEAFQGEVIVVDMNDSTIVPGEVIEEIADKDVTVRLEMDKDTAWEINGNSVTADTVKNIDLEVMTGSDANEIPVEIVNDITGERYTMNLSLTYDGEFGFTAVLCINLGKKNAGLYANLFYYDESAEEMEFICAEKIDKAGIARLSFTHASDYIIVIDSKAMNENSPEDKKEDGNDTKEDGKPVGTDEKDLPKTALKESVWFLFAGMLIILVGGMILLVACDKKRRLDK